MGAPRVFLAPGARGGAPGRRHGGWACETAGGRVVAQRWWWVRQHGGDMAPGDEDTGEGDGRGRGRRGRRRRGRQAGRGRRVRVRAKARAATVARVTGVGEAPPRCCCSARMLTKVYTGCTGNPYGLRVIQN